MRVEHPQCLAAAEKWLDAEVGVLVTGDVGGGKSTVLAELGRRARARGINVLALRGAAATTDVPLSAFALHDLRLQPRGGERVTVGDVRDHFLAELQGRRNLVIVDDVHQVDPTSLSVVESLVELSGAGLVCSVRPGVPPGPWLGLQVGGQPLARVPVDAIGIRGVARILEDHLEGVVDMSLIASLTAWSGGNARAALALIDAAVWAGAAVRVEGTWTEVTPLEDVPHSMVADAFCPALDADELTDLETLAWFGPLELQHAVRLVGTEGLQRLVAIERVATFHTHGGRSVLVAVSPPCLAHAVRLGLNVVRREELADLFEDTFEGPVSAPVPEWWSGAHSRRSLTEGDQQVDPHGFEPIPVVTERLAAQTVLRRDAWRSDPNVGTATRLLESLMNSDPPAAEVDEIFATTPIDQDGDLYATVEYVLKQAQWDAFRYADSARGVATLEAFVDRAGPYAPLLRAEVLAFECVEKGTAALMAAASDFPVAPDPENAWFVALRCLMLLEVGRTDEVLEMLADWDLEADQEPGSATDRLRALRSDALLLGGDVGEALAYSQECLAHAYDRLDALGIRMHSRGVSTALMFHGDSPGAWQVLSTVLRLGPPGPINVPYYQRILTMASVLRARQGDINLAQALLNQLTSMPRTYPLVLDALVPWANAELLCSEGKADEAAKLLWDAGIERRDHGFPGSALLCWLLRADRCSPDELAVLEAVWEQAPIPLLAPLVELHRQMAEGDPDGILDAMAGTGPVVGRWVIAKALEVAALGREEAGLKPFTPSDVRQRSGAVVAAEAETAGLVAEDVEALSERELEVALLARSGLSNREIANKLYLSVRTVENHMYRTLRKLGLGSRADLATDWEPETSASD